MTLFEIDWIPTYLSLCRSAIAVGAALIVAICLGNRREQRPISWNMTALVFGVGMLSNSIAAYTSSNPTLVAGLVLCVMNTALVGAVWSYALFGLRTRWDGWDDP